MKVLFVHPGDQRMLYQALANEYTAIATPSWTVLLAGACRERGIDASIYDANLEGWDEALAGKLDEERSPDLVVLMVYGHNPSASTQTMPVAGRIARDIKRHNHSLPVAMGGIHPSALPERTLLEEDVDFVVEGEGARAIPALLEYLAGKRLFDRVPGVWRNAGDGPERSAPPEIVEDLDTELPVYDWDLLKPLSNYRAHNMHCFQYFEESESPVFADVRSPYVAMNTSLGCPFSCSYCCINAIFGKPGIRYWSLERVMEWFDDLAERGVRNIRLDDELFILSPERVERFCDMLIERGHDFNIWVYGRVDTIRKKLLGKMRRAGISWICLGIESGDAAVLNGVNKRNRGDVGSLVKMIQDNGMYVLGNYMFGLPDDDMDSMRRTLDLAKRLDCEFANFYTVMAMPGSALYAEAEERGIVSDDWAVYSQLGYKTRPLPNARLSSEEILRFRDQAFDEYFKNAEYLDMVESRFGPKTRGHIERMTGTRLKREILGD